VNHYGCASSCDICSSSYSGRPIVVKKMRDGSQGSGRDGGWVTVRLSHVELSLSCCTKRIHINNVLQISAVFNLAMSVRPCIQIFVFLWCTYAW
jgi:hypothetical protein